MFKICLYDSCGVEIAVFHFSDIEHAVKCFHYLSLSSSECSFSVFGTKR